MSKERNEVALREDIENASIVVAEKDVLEMLKNPSANFFCSIIDDGTRESKVKIYNAINGCENQLSSCYGKTLEIVDVVVHPIKLTDEKTGEINEALRTVLIDKNGKSYQAVSDGVVSSLQKIFFIVGEPSWSDEPIKIIPTQQITRMKRNVTVLLLSV